MDILATQMHVNEHYMEEKNWTPAFVRARIRKHKECVDFLFLPVLTIAK
jgi:hypothetical protein